MLPQLILIALGTLASEDLTCVATGILIAQGRLSFAQGALACALGIFAGDLMLYFTGRLAGSAAVRWPWLARRVPQEQVARGGEWLNRRGASVILLSRFTPGLRLPTYFAAGLLPTGTARFTFFFLLSAVVWTPLMVGAAVVFGARLLWALERYGGAGVLFPAFVAITAGWLWRSRATAVFFVLHRRLIGFTKRLTQWEFWPAWATYAPVIPYFLFLAAKHRSLTLFTLANPGIEAGGFAGESKAAILTWLSGDQETALPFILIPAGLRLEQRLEQAYRFLQETNAAFPVVLKPDTGERGTGVAIVRSEEQLKRYLTATSSAVILQHYAEGSEFGVFYQRHPDESAGRIISITRKTFPKVRGNGRRTLRELILLDTRAVCLASIYERSARRPLEDVVEENVSVPLVELGSHCRGAVFSDARHLNTRVLEIVINRVSQRHPGFYFGRFDIRAKSEDDLQQGRFRVIELNGVAAEATHIYDPSVSLIEAYRTIFSHWRTAFAIGAENRKRGVRPMGLVELAARIWRHLRCEHAAGEAL